MRWWSWPVVCVLACGGDDPPHLDAPPITAPPNTWTWIEVPGTTCGNGTPAGFGINPPPGGANSDLFVYFQGGGACWDAASCFVAKTAVNVETTYDAARFAQDLGTSMADRSPANPFRAATLVVVPYCTGDLHAGTRPTDHGVGTVHHTGGLNTQRFVEALHATAPDAAMVWLAGSSAGGYGATLNLHRFAAAWPTAGVHVLQDSSPFVPVLANYATWQDAWGLEFPPGCAACATDFSTVISAVSAAHPTARQGLLHYDDDAVIKAYFGYPGSLVPATEALLADHYDQPATHAFVLAGTGHTMLAQLATLTGPGGVTLLQWVTEWATGDAAWTTVR